MPHHFKPVKARGEMGAGTSILWFFAITFVWSWTCWLVSFMLLEDFPFTASALAMIGGFGPSAAAVIMVAQTAGIAGSQQWLKRCLRWRVGWHWLLLAFLFPLVFMGLAAAVHVALGGTLPTSPATGHAPLVVLNFFLIFLVGGPLGEEFGWRGYALPALQLRWGWRTASLVLGGVWALWHLPLFYSAGSVQSQLPMGFHVLSTVASSVLFAWLYNRTRASLIPALLLHTAVNAWSMVIPVMVLPDGSNLRPFQLVVSILVVVAVALLFSSSPSDAHLADDAP